MSQALRGRLLAAYLPDAVFPQSGPLKIRAFLTVDDPFAESKEHIGGSYLIESENLDAALAWASNPPRVVRKPIEVCPFVD